MSDRTVDARSKHRLLRGRSEIDFEVFKYVFIEFLNLFFKSI